MSNRLTILIIINFGILCTGILGVISKNKPQEQIVVQAPVDEWSAIPIEEKPDLNYDISSTVPAYKDNDGTCDQLQEWHEEAPELTEIGTYGTSTKGRELHFIKIENPYEDVEKPVVLITACLHGNEPLSSSTVMGYIGTILDSYGDDEDITELVNSRIIYFVPVVSPDSYPHSRHVDGVDPNRNWPGPKSNKQSVKPVHELQAFFNKIKPNAVISGHTWGRIYLTPFGDRNQLCPNDADYQRIIGEMGRLSKYKMQRASQMYGRPIYGTEVDWYYRHGAFSIVMEFGTHQRIPSQSDINTEFNRTFSAALHFIKEAPVVEIKQYAVEEWLKAA